MQFISHCLDQQAGYDSFGTAKVVYQIPSADGYLIDPDYPVDSWLN
jgi:hypothetical protein